MHLARVFLCFFAAINFFNSALANPWLQKPGEGLLILNGLAYATDTYFDSEGQKTAQPRFSKYELNPYLEYGLNEH
jgi:hypothetical protein